MNRCWGACQASPDRTRAEGTIHRMLEALLGLTASILIAGCRSAGDPGGGNVSAFVAYDDWWSPPEDFDFSCDDATLVRELWEMPTSSFAMAESLLAHESVVELTPGLLGMEGWGTPAQVIQEVFGFRDLPEANEGAFYLVRALFVDRGGGGGSFRVFHENGNVLVTYTCMGHGNASMARSALILFLPTRPERAYSCCGLVD